MDLNTNIIVKWYTWATETPFRQEVVTFFAHTIDEYIIAGVILFLVWRLWKRFHVTGRLIDHRVLHELFMFLIAGCVGWGISSFLKILIHAPRPFLIPELGITPLFIPGLYDAFPSGHATVFFTLAFIMMYHDRYVGYFLLIMAILITLARVASGVHFPFDIIGGLVVAGMVSFGMIQLDRHAQT